MYSEGHLQELSDKAYRYALLVVKNKEDALDVMQETLYRYIVKKTEFDDKRAEVAWIYKVASNLSRNILMNSWYKRRAEISAEAWERIPDRNDTENTREDSIFSVVRKLPKKYSDVIFFYYYEEYPADVICTILGIKEGTFYSRLTRARKMLRRRLDAEKEDIGEQIDCT